MPRMLAHGPADLAVLDVLPTAVALPAPVVEQPVRWRLRTRITFRLCFLYFGLYVLTTQMLGGLLMAPFLPNLGATGLLKNVVVWTSNNVFKVSYPYMTTLTGSGAKTIDWVHVFVLLVPEQSFPRLDHPELLAEVAEGANYEDGVRVVPVEPTAEELAA